MQDLRCSLRIDSLVLICGQGDIHPHDRDHEEGIGREEALQSHRGAGRFGFGVFFRRDQ